MIKVRGLLTALGVVTALLVTASCSGSTQDPAAGSASQSESEVEAEAKNEAKDADPGPPKGACYAMEPNAISQVSNNSSEVECSEPHNAETFHVDYFTGESADAKYGDEGLGAEVFKTCDQKYRKFARPDASLAVRTILTWGYFLPTEEQWEDGSRWFRCDIFGGDEVSTALVPLPQTAKNILAGRPGDEWISCVAEDVVAGAPRVPCTEKHQWRAVTTISLGTKKAKYPGNRLVEVNSRDQCTKSVAYWLNEPVEPFEFAYTFFGKAEWEAGNRRSVCWARTSQ